MMPGRICVAALAGLSLVATALGQIVTTASVPTSAFAQSEASGPRVLLRVLSHTTVGPEEDEAEFFVFYNNQVALVNSPESKVNFYSISATGQVELVDSLDVAGTPNSVTFNARDNVLAVAVAAPVVTDPGHVLFVDAATRTVLTNATTGPNPDHVSFGPGFQCLYSADEGEPADGVNPTGGVTQVCAGDFANASQHSVSSSSFADIPDAVALLALQQGGHNPDAAQDGATMKANMEPEFASYSEADGSGDYKVYIVCQEANVFVEYSGNTGSTADISTVPDRILPLGYKNHGLEGNGMDAFEDGTINVTTLRNVLGIYQPDTIKAVAQGGTTFIVAACEGDAASDIVEDEAEVGDLVFAPGTLDAPVPADLRVSKVRGVNPANASEHLQAFSFGGRGFAVFDAATGALAHESGDQMAQMMIKYAPELFNADDGDFFGEGRSENKGAEPEAITTGEFNGTPLLFVGLERPGLVGVWDMTDITAPVFHSLNGVVDPDGCVDGERALMVDPEALQFVAAADSPTGTDILISSGAVSATLTVFELYESSDVADLFVCPQASQGPGNFGDDDSDTKTAAIVVLSVVMSLLGVVFLVLAAQALTASCAKKKAPAAAGKEASY